MSTTKRLLTIEDIHKINQPEQITNLFEKLGYQACYSPLNIQDLELSQSSYQYINKAYLVANQSQGDIQVIIFEIHSQHWNCDTTVTKIVKTIGNSLCQRPSIFLLLFTYRYQKLLLVSPKKQFNESMDLELKLTKTIVNLANPYIYDINVLEKISFNNFNDINYLHKKISSFSHQSRLFSDKRKKANCDSVRSYLQEIGKFKLLKIEQEISLGRKIKAYAELIDQQAKFEKILEQKLTFEELSILAEIDFLTVLETVEEGILSINKLVEHNLRLVVSIAKKYSSRGLDLLDLIQAGNLGIIRAAQKFDYTKGYKFSTYATHWIRQSITREIQNSSRTIRLPVHLWESMNQIKKARRKIQESGYPITFAEVVKHTEYDPIKISRTISSFNKIGSLDKNLSNANGKSDSFINFLASEDRSLEDNLLKREIIDTVCFLTQELNEQEKKVIENRFGLNGCEESSLQKIGDTMGLTRERIRQIEVKALAKLKSLSSSLEHSRNPYKQFKYKNFQREICPGDDRSLKKYVNQLLSSGLVKDLSTLIYKIWHISQSSLQLYRIAEQYLKKLLCPNIQIN